MMWMKLERITQIEVKEKEKCQYSILAHIYGIWNAGMMRLYARQQKRHRCKTVFWTMREKSRVGQYEGNTLKHVYYYMLNRVPVQIHYLEQGI